MIGNPEKVMILFNDEIKYTENLFGTVEDLQRSQLYLIEQNNNGDCLCVAKTLNKEEYLVDISNKDIKKIVRPYKEFNSESLIPNIIDFIKSAL